MKLRTLVFAGGFFVAACAQNPRSVIDQVITEKHFIPYELPMPSTRVGTVLRGNAQTMYLVARPETCFPDLGGLESLRWVQPTDLPDQLKVVEFGFNGSANAILQSGSISLKLKTDVNYVKKVQVQFQGASVEFLEEFSFKNYFNHGMSEACKDLLLQYPFIGQGLRVDSIDRDA